MNIAINKVFLRPILINLPPINAPIPYPKINVHPNMAYQNFLSASVSQPNLALKHLVN